jgi:hypothetical protein
MVQPGIIVNIALDVAPFAELILKSKKISQPLTGCAFDVPVPTHFHITTSELVFAMPAPADPASITIESSPTAVTPEPPALIR